MDLGIVTSFYNYYDRYLDQWIEAIANLKTKPAFISIVVSGDAYNPQNIQNCEEVIKELGTPYKIDYIEHQGMGVARNKAVENSPTEWIMYLDVDDTILPNAIDVYKRFQHKTDVIVGGLRVVGDKPNRDILFQNTSNAYVRMGKHGATSSSVYRKELWQKMPYITKNDYIEQTLWLGFSQIGARFVPTKEVCVIYNSSVTGHNFSMTNEMRDEARLQWKDFVQNGVRYD